MPGPQLPLGLKALPFRDGIPKPFPLGFLLPSAAWLCQFSIYHNPGSPPGAATVADNRVSGYTAVDNLRGPVSRSGNVIAQGEACPG